MQAGDLLLDDNFGMKPRLYYFKEEQHIHSVKSMVVRFSQQQTDLNQALG